MAHSSSINRKSLKRPDEFTSALRSFFDRFSKNSRQVTIAGGVVVACSLAFMFYLNHRADLSERATEALYSARKAQESEFKALALKEPVKETEDQKKAKAKSKEAAKTEAPTEPTAEQMAAAAHKVLAAAAVYPEGVKKLIGVTEEFAGTRAGFEAAIALGNLFMQHGESAEAAQWFQKAAGAAPSRFENALALYSRGVALENVGKNKEALGAFSDALNLGQEPIKGELLMAKARTHEALGEKEQAAATYKRVIEELKDTSYSRDAELKSAKLGS